MFLDSAVAKEAKLGDQAAKPKLFAKALVMQQMMRGIDFWGHCVWATIDDWLRANAYVCQKKFSLKVCSGFW